ncbi:MAG: HU family DNA-binding protein [Bacteroides thetaiotaomicron]
MNALYDFFLTPQPKDSNKTRYHARLVVRDTITLEDIAETIESRSSLRQSDVIGSFIEFANVFKQELSNGNSIHIPGVGSFRIKAESPEVRSPKEIRAENIHCSGIVFTPEKDLLRELKATTFEKVSETRRSQELSDIEIDGRLAEFFKDNSCITTQQALFIMWTSKSHCTPQITKAGG